MLDMRILHGAINPVDRKHFSDTAMETELSENYDHSIVKNSTLRAGSPIMSSVDNDYGSDPDWVPDLDDNSNILYYLF